MLQRVDNVDNDNTCLRLTTLTMKVPPPEYFRRLGEMLSYDYFFQLNNNIQVTSQY